MTLPTRAAHNVRFHRTGHKRIHHPVAGVLDLDFEAMEFPAHPVLTLLVHTAAAAPPPPTASRCSPAGPLRLSKPETCPPESRHRAVHSVVLSWC
jgi:hypothetical protein